MKFLIIFAIFIAVVVARSPAYQPTTYKPSAQKFPTNSNPIKSASTGDATILNRDFMNDGTNYQFAFETSDGIKRNEVGEQKTIGEGSGIVMRGEYSYIGPDGNTYRVTGFVFKLINF